ncbi:hypothetical protein Syun_015829 [Stephania yunnanensis]|uniref:Uncharacterized protein n=1 Tax=Stephania yunnanensis TaxID=152371 RepID=A0AAP0J3M7_9MAGN
MAEAVARDRVGDPVECTDRDNDLVMHRGKDMDMFQLERDFDDVALEYIDGRRQMVCSLLGGRGGAQLVTEEPSLSRRSPALQSKMGVWPWADWLGGLRKLRRAEPNLWKIGAVTEEVMGETVIGLAARRRGHRTAVPCPEVARCGAATNSSARWR